MASLNVTKYSGAKNPPIGSPGGMTLREVNHQTFASCMHTTFNIGTWNVRGLLQPGKLHILEQELNKTNMSITGISETHWRGRGHFTTPNGNTILFSGNDDNSRNGVALILSRTTSKSIMSYNTINDRIAHVKLDAKPIQINIIQIYAPTSESTEDDIEEFYGILEDTVSKIPNKELLIIIGDFNAKIGDTQNDDHLRAIVGKFGLGERNERGERLLNFCSDTAMTVANTVYKQHSRRLYTWESPNGSYRNQIDYILIRTRWRTSIKSAKTLPGAECGSDHKLLTAKLKLKLKAPIRKTIPRRMKIADESKFRDKLKEKMYPYPLALPPNETSEDLWKKTKDIIAEALRETETKDDTQADTQKHWMKDPTLQIVEKRRKLRRAGISTEAERNQYTQLNREIQRACRRDKNDYLISVCNEAQKHADNNNTKDLYRLVKKINRRFTPRTWAIQNDRGEKVTGINEILDVWKNYCKDLFHDEPAAVTSSEQHVEEPKILMEEIKNAIKKLKPNKSPGPDGITTEVIKSMGEHGINMFHNICNKIWSSGQWPKEWTDSNFISLHKKGSKEKCENFRLIALISHASKILLYIINDRLKSFLSWQIPPEQAGFAKGRGTREQILNLRQIIEKAREINKPLYICFIDYCKAFDSLRWGQLWKILAEMGVPPHLVSLIQQLYQHSTATVRVDKYISDHFPIKKGARQGCILSPMLFNIYGEYIMRRVLDTWQGGVIIGGVKISNLRYADDTILLANTPEELEEVIEKLEDESSNFGLDINDSKTKVMIIDRKNNNRPDVTQIGQYQVVQQYTYLGVLINNTGDNSHEIRRRCEMARTTAKNLQRTWRDSDITLNTKKKIIQTLIFPVLLYGAESWTLKAQDRRRIDSFELWCWRRILRIPWTARRTNESVLKEIGEPQRLSQTVYTRILKYFGHITRKDDASLERLVVQGKMEGKRERGRPPKRWLDLVKEKTNGTIQQATSNAKNRERWREVVRRVIRTND